MKLLAAALLFANLSFADYKVGDAIKNFCWFDSASKSHCSKDDDGKVRIFLYNATWCVPCQRELRDLSRRTLKTGVVYYSLTCDNTLSASQLADVDRRFGLSSRGILALNSARNCGRDFAGNGKIPAVAVIGADGTLKSFAINPGVDWILGW